MAERRLGQPGWADALVGGGRPGGGDARLERIASLVDWGRLAAVLGPLHAGTAGRPAYPALLTAKALLLQQWYGLSDAGLEEALADRLSFRRFVGLGLDEPTPDHTTLCRFRRQPAEAGLGPAPLAELDRQLAARGLVLKRGTLIDATLVRAAVRPSGPAAAPSGPDAALARRQGEAGSAFGFEAHLAMDRGSGLIRRARC